MATYAEYYKRYFRRRSDYRNRVRGIAKKLRQSSTLPSTQIFARALKEYLQIQPKTGNSMTLPKEVESSLATLKKWDSVSCPKNSDTEAKKEVDTVAEMLEREAESEGNAAVICSLLHLEDTYEEMRKRQPETADTTNCVENSHCGNETEVKTADIGSYQWYQRNFQSGHEEHMRQYVQEMGKLILKYRAEHEDDPALNYSIDILNTYLGGTQTIDKMQQVLENQEQQGIQRYEDPHVSVSMKWIEKMSKGEIVEKDKICGILYLRGLYLNYWKEKKDDNLTVQKLSKFIENLGQWREKLRKGGESVRRIADELESAREKEEFSKFAYEIIALDIYTKGWPWHSPEEAAQIAAEARNFCTKLRDGKIPKKIRLKMKNIVADLHEIAKYGALYDLEHVLELFDDPFKKATEESSSVDEGEVPLDKLDVNLGKELDREIDEEERGDSDQLKAQIQKLANNIKDFNDNQSFACNQYLKKLFVPQKDKKEQDPSALAKKVREEIGDASTKKTPVDTNFLKMRLDKLVREGSAYELSALLGLYESLSDSPHLLETVCKVKLDNHLKSSESRVGFDRGNKEEVRTAQRQAGGNV